MKELTIYSNGLLHCSVCTNIKNKKDIEARVNTQNPTGIRSLWKIDNKNFADGTKNPCPCNTKPKTHKHYLMIC